MLDSHYLTLAITRVGPCAEHQKNQKYACCSIPRHDEMGLTVIDKSQPIESIGLRLRDHTRTFDSGVRARFNFCRTLPLVGIVVRILEILFYFYRIRILYKGAKRHRGRFEGIV